MTFLVRFFASGFGAGFFPIAPGTVGSAVALFAWYGLSAAGLYPRSAQLFLILSITFIALASTEWWFLLEESKPHDTTNRDNKAVNDPGWITIDEWAGMFVALFGLTFDDPELMIIAFLLFRFFDVLKPGPIALAEKLPRGLGVVADDLVGGLCAWIVLYGLRICIL